MDITNLFTLSASEVKTQNAWSKEFLPGWIETFEPEKSKIKFSHREMIIVEPRSRNYFEPQKTKPDQTTEIIKLDDFKINGENVKWNKTPYNLFATYTSGLPREINYYEDYYNAREEIKHLVRIHERMHAYHHVNSEGVWESFNATSIVYKEFLAQIFTFKCVQGTDLEPYFMELSTSQPYIYKTWESAKELTNVEVMALYTEIKDKGKSSFGDLEKLAKVYDQISRAQPTFQPNIERLNKEHDEIFKNNDGFPDKRIKNDVSDVMDDLW